MEDIAAKKRKTTVPDSFALSLCVSLSVCVLYAKRRREKRRFVSLGAPARFGDHVKQKI